MKISNAFPSEYLRAIDLNGRNVMVVIDRAEMAELSGGDHKPVLYFKGKEKGLILNKTNANNIAAVYGDDTDDWEGKELILFSAMVDMQGKTVPAIRVRAPMPKDRPSKPKPAVDNGNDSFGHAMEDIPF